MLLGSVFPSGSATHIRIQFERENQKLEDTPDKSRITLLSCFAYQVTLKTLPCLGGLVCAASKNRTWLTIPKPFCLLYTNSGLPRKRNMLIRAALSWLVSALTWPLLPWLLRPQRCVDWAVIYREVFWRVDVADSPCSCVFFCVAWPLPWLWLCPSSAQPEWWGRKIIRPCLQWADGYFCEVLRIVYSSFSCRVFPGTSFWASRWNTENQHFFGQVTLCSWSALWLPPPLSMMECLAEAEDKCLSFQWHSSS